MCYAVKKIRSYAYCCTLCVENSLYISCWLVLRRFCFVFKVQYSLCSTHSYWTKAVVSVEVSSTNSLTTCTRRLHGRRHLMLPTLHHWSVSLDIWQFWNQFFSRCRDVLLKYRVTWWIVNDFKWQINYVRAIKYLLRYDTIVAWCTLKYKIKNRPVAY